MKSFGLSPHAFSANMPTAIRYVKQTEDVNVSQLMVTVKCQQMGKDKQISKGACYTSVIKGSRVRLINSVGVRRIGPDMVCSCPFRQQEIVCTGHVLTTGIVLFDLGMGAGGAAYIHRLALNSQHNYLLCSHTGSIGLCNWELAG